MPWLDLYRRLSPLLGILLVPLLLLLVIQKGETRHWKKQSAGFERLYHDEQAAFATTVANYRVAAAAAAAADQANARRVVAEQAQINKEQSNAYETRLAAARATAERLRSRAATTNSGGSGSAAVPGVPAPAGQPSQAPGQDRLSDALTATEQAIQLDELIKWVDRQHAVDPNK